MTLTVTPAGQLVSLESQLKLILKLMLFGVVPKRTVADIQYLRGLSPHPVRLFQCRLQIALLGFRDHALEVDALRKDIPALMAPVHRKWKRMSRDTIR